MPPMVQVQGSEITVREGTYGIGGGEAVVRQTRTFVVAPAPRRRAENEPLKLSPDKPDSWGRGTPLRALNARDINARGAFKEGSLELRKTPGGPLLTEGTDYLVSPEFGMVGLAPGSALSADDTVYATYDYGLLRIDSIQLDPDGVPALASGAPDIATPLPPEPPPGWVTLLNIYRPYHETSLKEEDLFPVLETAAMAKTGTTRGRIPRTLARLQAGKPVKVVCWGDSVTAGGNASTPDMAYVRQFERRLRQKFPNAPVEVVNISYGGSCSAQWLRFEPFADFAKGATAALANDVDFSRVEAARPDLLTIEFVNDAGLRKEHLERVYAEVLRRMQALSCEIILITPHFTSLPMMGIDSVRSPESRPYVRFLFDFSEAHGLAVADASARWAHLWKEGLPYLTLLDNTINHPDDRGHALFADELVRCFE